MAEFRETGKISTVIDKFTRDLIQHLPAKNRNAELCTIFQFVRDEIRYVLDINGVERLCTAEQTLENANGDCDDKCILLGAMLENVGFKTRFHAVGFQRIGDFSHVITDVRMGGPNQWLTLDACVAGVPPGWRPPGVVTHLLEPNRG